MPIIDLWSLYDNTENASPIVKNGIIVDKVKFLKIKESCQNKKKIILSDKITEGIRKAQKRLFERKAKLGECVVIADENGLPIIVKAEDLIKHYRNATSESSHSS